MAKSFFSEREVRLARSFIHAIGGNEKNGYLLLAVIAWQRAMSKGHETFWKSLSKYSAFRAGQLLAAKLKRKAQLDHKSYGSILTALRRGGKDSGYADQARDFLRALSLSKWDKDHYGYKAYAQGHWDHKQVWHQTSASGSGYWEDKWTWVPEQQEEDPLQVLWAKLTGHNIPKKYFVDTVKTPATKTPKPDPHRQPRSLTHVLPTPDYIGPYAARTFYEARPHLGANVLPDF